MTNSLIARVCIYSDPLARVTSEIDSQFIFCSLAYILAYWLEFGKSLGFDISF